MTPADRNRRLVRALTAGGVLDPEWRNAFLATPRHQFLPDEVWTDELEPLWRREDPDAWMDAAYTDAPIVVQVDDGRTFPGSRGRSSSSSASMPTMVALMLRHIDAHPGDQVLEIGTGTGWNAGVLAARFGDASVTTVEVDPGLAEAARVRLAAVGRYPTVVTGDGAGGWPESAPYDRVLSTVAVDRVPYAWVAQTRADGLVVTPWGNRYYNGSLLRLTVEDKAVAMGRIVDHAAFMHLRSQRWPLVHLDADIRYADAADRSVTDVHPYYVTGADGALLAIGQRVPRCRPFSDAEDDGVVTTWFVDHASGSWSSLRYEPGAEKFPVRQGGPRRLWDEVEATYRWWVAAGEPGPERYGITVTPQGQTVWLDDPDNPVT